MKKLIATTAAALLAAATLSAGDGLKVYGFVQGGVSDDITDSVAGFTTWNDGNHWGAPSRLRLNVDYENDFGGVTFRFQKSGDLTTDWFTSTEEKELTYTYYEGNDKKEGSITYNSTSDAGNVKWAMGYAKFLENMLIVEGGYLVDNYTATEGDFGAAFDGSAGIRLVVNPIENLFITAQVSNYNVENYNYDTDELTTEKKKRRNGKPKFNEKLVSATAKYSTDAFSIVAGAHFSGIFYGSFAYTGIENLTLAAEVIAYQTNYVKGYKIEESDAKKTVHNTLLTAMAEYSAEPVTFGAVAYFYLADDNFFKNGDNDDFNGSGTDRFFINPYVAYDLSEMLQLRAEAMSHFAYDTDDVDNYTTITPSAIVKASNNAFVNVWLTVSTDTDQEHHSTGVGVKYVF